MDQEVTVQTTSGPVVGLKGYRFLGIPYAAAERFRAARASHWDAPKVCKEYGNISLQPNFLGKRKPGAELRLLGSEDCLNLNIWTPSLDPARRLPVVIYVHGGAFQTGSNSHPERSGEAFAKGSPMVFVSVNYRLGVLGGLYLDDLLGEEYAGSGSNSARDVLLAVRWVKANAAAFGGDPENITLMGISAGAKCIGALMTLEESSRLFSKVILESGAMQALRSRAAARELRDRYMACLGGVSPRDLPSMPAEALLKAQAAFCDREGSTAFFGPVLDETVFQSGWLARWQSGNVWKGRAMIGSGLNEMSRLAEEPAFLESPAQTLRDLFGGGAEALCRLHEDGALSWTRILSDAMYRSASDRLAQRLSRNADPVWVYSFDFAPAHHGMGFHFMMRQESSAYCRVPEQERAAAEKTAAIMNRCARDFILSGDPDPGRALGWQTITEGGRCKLSFGREITFRPFLGDSLAEMPEYTYCERRGQE